MNIPWSENWCINGNEGCFVGGMNNRLYTVDIMNKKFSCVAALPDFINTYRCNPFCYRTGNKVFLFPDLGDCIHVFNQESKEIEHIRIDRGEKERLSVNNCWFVDDVLYFISDTTAEIYGINVITNTIEKIVELDDGCRTLNGRGAIMNDGLIYVGEQRRGVLYVINPKTGSFHQHDISALHSGIGTLVYTSDYLVITGKNRTIVKWNKNDEFYCVQDFPKDFGMYPEWPASFCTKKDTVSEESDFFLFNKSYLSNGQIWFIPMISSNVVKFNYLTDSIELFPMPENEDEMESINDKQVDLCIKYIPEYFRENRYIGMYSIKTNRIFEIDTFEGRAYIADYEEVPVYSETELELNSLLREVGVV